MSSRSIALFVGLLVASLAGVVHGAGPYPEARSWSPTGTDVPLDVALVIEWTTEMDTNSVENAFNLTDGRTVWDRGSFSWIHSSVPPWTSRATPRFPLQTSTVYGAFVAPTATDVTGTYALDQDGDGTGGEQTDFLVWTFTTEDRQPPRVVATIPADGDEGVATDADIELRFNEPMDTASVEAAFGLTPGAHGTFSWALLDSRVRFDPSLNLAFGTTYTVRLNGSVARDVSGNLIDGDGDGVGGDDHRFSFTTEPDVAPPQVDSVVPGDGTVGASVSARVNMRFSETMNRSSVEDAFSFTDGVTAWNKTSGTFLWAGADFADDTAEFNPTTNFAFSKTFIVTLNAGIASDAAGFTLDGDGDGIAEGSPTDNFVWSFTTEGSDSTPPTVATVEPPGGATDVVETTGIVFTFSESMDPTSVEDAFALSDGLRTWTRENGTFAWDAGNESAVYTPGTALAFRRMYTVVVAGAIAEDVNGNALDGDGDGVGGDDFVSTFQTRTQPDVTPPHVLGTIPADGETDVPRVPVITIAFDDAMNVEATEAAISLANVSFDGARAIDVGNFRWFAADHAVSFQPFVPLDWDAMYRVTVSQAARDDADLALETPYTFSFHTALWRGRVVGRVVEGGTPVGGATVTLGEQTTHTSPVGEFEFPNVVAGRYNITVSKRGYETKRITVELDHTDVGPDLGTIELDAIDLRRVEGVNPGVVLGIVLALLGALIVLAWTVRRRRSAAKHFEGMRPEDVEAKR